MEGNIEQNTNLLEELAEILGLKTEINVSFGGLCLRKAGWLIWQLTEEKPHGSGTYLNRLHAVTGFRDFDDSFVSSSPARVAEILFGIKADGMGTVSREAFRDVAQRLADPHMTNEERVLELNHLFDQADKGQGGQ